MHFLYLCKFSNRMCQNIIIIHFLLLRFAGQDDETEVITESSSFVKGEPPQQESAPPKADSDVEVLHEKVTKQIIKEGHGQKPSKYSTCFCKYHSYL